MTCFHVYLILITDTHRHRISFFFFFNDPPPTEIYPLPLHDALPICHRAAGSTATVPRHFRPRDSRRVAVAQLRGRGFRFAAAYKRVHVLSHAVGGYGARPDRKSTRLNSSHSQISYAVFCLKKKKKLCNEPKLTLKVLIFNDYTHLVAVWLRFTTCTPMLPLQSVGVISTLPTALMDVHASP